MIQRIQTIYLIIAALILVGLNFIGLGVDTTPDPDDIVYGKDLFPVFVSSLVIGGLTLLSVFLYSNRKLQMNVCKLNIFLTIVLIAMMIYLLFLQPESAVEMVREGLILPVLAIGFIAFGMKKINTDEKLVRSIDRLR